MADLCARRRARRGLARLLCVLAFVYVALLGVLYAAQRQLIFHAYSTHHAAREALPKGARWVTFSTANGDAVSALSGTALLPNGQPDPQAARRPTLLFFYGKGMCADKNRAPFDAFRRLDANVLMPDYVGFGRSPGEPSEAGCEATADAAYRFLLSRPGMTPRRIVVAGFSLGSAVAIDLAARASDTHRAPAGLAVFAAFTSMAETAHAQYPLYPAPLLTHLVRSPFASAQKMGRVACPVLLVHSRADRTVPYWMDDTLAASCRAGAARLTLDGVPHGLLFSKGGPQVYPALARFLRRVA